METRFIQVGQYLVNISSIAYTRTVGGQMKIVLSSPGEDGKPWSLLVSEADAAKIIRKLNPFILEQKPGEEINVL